MTIGGASRIGGIRAAVLVVVLSTLGLTSVGVTGASATESDTIASLVNQARAAAGLPALAHNPAMDAVALRWAQQMAATNTMSHNPSYAAQIPPGWTRAGENVAMGQPTPSAMHDAWMNSPGHRANILGDFTDVGIAFITVAGTTWGVEDFGKYAAHASAPAPAAAPAPVAKVPAVKAAAPVVKAAAPPPPAPVAPSPAPPVATTTPSPDASTTARPSAAASTHRSTSPTPRTEQLTSTAVKSAQGIPVGYILGIVLVALGVAGGIYGQMLRRRGRRSPDA